MPALMVVITVLSGGSWRVTGGAALLAPLVVGFVGASSAVYARTAPVALGLMAAEVLAIGSLFRPGGVFGAAFLLAVGAVGGWLGGVLVDDSDRLEDVPGGTSSLQRIAFGWGAGALVVAAMLAAWSPSSLSSPAADDSRPRYSVRQYRPPAHPDPCTAASLPLRQAAEVSLTSVPSDGVAVGAMPLFTARFRLTEGIALPVGVFVVVKQATGNESYSDYLGESDKTSGTVGASWNGDRCSGGDEPGTFTNDAKPGEYVAHALVVVDGVASASPPVRFRVGKP